jgi:hypothetical protein
LNLKRTRRLGSIRRSKRNPLRDRKARGNGAFRGVGLWSAHSP